MCCQWVHAHIVRSACGVRCMCCQWGHAHMVRSACGVRCMCCQWVHTHINACFIVCWKVTCMLYIYTLATCTQLWLGGAIQVRHIPSCMLSKFGHTYLLQSLHVKLPLVRMLIHCTIKVYQRTSGFLRQIVPFSDVTSMCSYLWWSSEGSVGSVLFVVANHSPYPCSQKNLTLFSPLTCSSGSPVVALAQNELL